MNAPEPAAPEIVVTFLPEQARAAAPLGATLLAAAQAALIGLRADCGGIGACEACCVRVAAGRISPPTLHETVILSEEALADGWRLACQACAEGDCAVEAPAASREAPLRTQTAHAPAALGWDPEIRTAIAAPGAALAEDVWQAAGLARPSRLSPAAEAQRRRLQGASRVKLLARRSTGEVIGVRPAGAAALGLAVDIGTTKVAAYLVDLESGEVVEAFGFPNPQQVYGADVIARVAAAGRSEAALTELLRRSIGQAAARLCAAHGAAPEAVAEVVAVGNTVMHHLLLGLPVEGLGAAPFTPARRERLYAPASRLGLAFSEDVWLYTPPVIAGFVGADHVSALVAAGFARRSGSAMLLDIGTNTEISLLHEGRILACSCASGPAFEGAQIRQGMRAVPGAIERVRALEEGSWTIETVGGEPPIGFCGSGVLDAVAVLRAVGVLDRMGRMRGERALRDACRGGAYCVVAPAAEGRRAVVLTRADVQQVQLAKAAVRTGVDLLLAHAGLTADQVERYIVAGAFGAHLDPAHAAAIGMLPASAVERTEQVGNAAGQGAVGLLVNRALRREAEALGERVQHLELTTHPRFADAFTDNLSL